VADLSHDVPKLLTKLGGAKAVHVVYEAGPICG